MAVSADANALQCVPFARQASGISLRGDAWTWWGAAAGQYERGQTPRVGAVVVFKKHGSMRHGHVAVVKRVVNSREVLVDHANWAPQRGRGRGLVSKMVAVTDVSPRNDWSEVRVWNSSSQDFGMRIYPTYGFIYPANGHTYFEAASLSGYDDLPDESWAASANSSAAAPKVARKRPDTAKAESARAGLSAKTVAPASVQTIPVSLVAAAAPMAEGVWEEDQAAAKRFGSGQY